MSEACQSLPSEIERAQGAPDASVAPAATHAKENAAGTPKHWHSLRNGFTAYTRSPRSAGLVSLRRPGIAAGRTEGRHRHHPGLDPSVGGSGPRDFTVRQKAFVHARDAR
jgi:hypothetical protein